MYVLKLILLANIFGTSTLIGILISKKYSNRVNILKDLKNALNIFQVKINYSLETIPEIFEEISNKIKGPAGKIFKDTVVNINNKNQLAGTAWENAVDLNASELNIEDIRSIKTLGKMLGSTDIEGQINQIELVIKFIDTQIEEAVQEKNSNAKMYKKLGAIIGLIIVIVLI